MREPRADHRRWYFNIETQNNIMIVTSYVFDDAGKQIWYLSAGLYDENARTFTSTFANATNGSCLSCSYEAPTKNGNAGGNMTIVFSSRESGTITFRAARGISVTPAASWVISMASGNSHSA